MTAPLILGTNSIKSTGYDVANSLRFNDGSSDFLNKTPSGAGNRQTFTVSMWFKRANVGTSQYLFNAKDGSAAQDAFFFSTSNTFYIALESVSGSLETNRVFRDNSSWYHFVIAVDTTQGTDTNRIKLYVNGVQETSFNSPSYPSQNANCNLNTAIPHNIGRRVGTSGDFIDGYLAEMVFIDGSALAPTDFGEFDEDSPTIWKPKDPSGLTFGTNGFYLDFEDSSALGNDAAGSNNYSVNNLAAVDQSTDTCTNNFCTANFLDNFYAQSTFNNGLLQVISTTSNAAYNKGTFGVSKGKWYYEVKIVDSSSNGTIGVGWIASSPTSTTDQMKNKTNQSTYRDNGTIFGNGSEIVTGSSLANNDIVGVYFDADNNFVYYAKNGSFQNSGNPTSGASGTGGIDPGAVATATPEGFYFPAFGDHSGGQNVGIEFNFGSPSYTISSGNSDADGHGNFEYSVPSGYFTLCSKNLAEYG